MTTVTFFEKDELTLPQIMPYDVQVKQYSWNVFGGPEEMTCEINFQGGTNRSLLWTMTEYLRAGVQVYNDYGIPVWWGYVKKVTIYDGDKSYGIDLELVFNRVKAVYELIAVGDSTGLRGDTTWQQDTRSQNMIGTREKIYSLVTVSTAAADADVLTRLNKARYPVSIADLAVRKDEGQKVEFLCRGWWDTLGWQYYENASLVYETVEGQIYDMIQAGEFFNAVFDRVTASTLTTEYRKGDNMIKDEVEQLMNIGTDNSRRVLSTVTEFQDVYIYEEPPNDEDVYLLDSNNRLRDPYGLMIDPTVCKVGVWAHLSDFEHVAQLTDNMVVSSPVFIERATYDAETGEYTPEQRGYRSPFEELQDVYR